MKLPLRYNLRSLVERKTRTAMTILSIATAIFLSIMMVALSRGLVETTRATGSPLNVIVLSQGAESMEFSAIDAEIVHHLQALSGQPLVSAQAYISTFVAIGGVEKRGVVRGLHATTALGIHDNARLLEGRLPNRGFELAVGNLAATKLGVAPSALAIGQAVDFEGQSWTIVGRFEAPNTILDSELWADVDDILLATKRSDYSAVMLRTKDAKAAGDILFALALRTDIRVGARAEREYYGVKARAMEPLRSVALVMTLMLVLGGILAGMNTMFTSISGRTREMGVLLVLGYHRRAVLFSFMLESLAMCLAGGLVGCTAGLLLNGLPMKIPMGVFRFVVDAQTLAMAMALAAFIGIVGALVPVLRVARLSVVAALRD
ncbi:MAG: ABC transporter permease [Bradymonadaceae bacterium]|nr:ABC transporter permease [Lujinxingiaceae bacterium]